MLAIFAWFNDARISASRWNRAIRPESAAKASGSSLMATSRLSLVSRALNLAHAAGARCGPNLVRTMCVPAAIGMRASILHQPVALVTDDLQGPGQARESWRRAS